MKELSKVGIETKIHYPIPLHLQNVPKVLAIKKAIFQMQSYLLKHDKFANFPFIKK